MKTNWINIFFMILVILLIVWLISAFFGFSIPNWRGVQVKTENAFSNMEVKTSMTKAQVTRDGLDPVLFIRPLCQAKCSENDDFSNLYGTRHTFDSYYFDNDSFIVCKCKRER